MAKNDTDRTTGEEVVLALAAFAWKTLCTWRVTLVWGALFVFAYQEAFLFPPLGPAVLILEITVTVNTRNLHHDHS